VPAVVWEPYALAVVFGLVVSAAIYFVVMWPQSEPDEEELGPVAVAPPASEPETEPAPAAVPETDPDPTPDTRD
jgi:hypothetical protein